MPGLRRLSYGKGGVVHLTARFLRRVLGTRPRSRLNRLIGFGLVGISGLLINQLALFTITEGAGIHYVLSAIVASQISTLWNFALTETLVFRSRRFPGRLRRVFLFSAMNNLWLVGRLPLLYLLTDGVGLHYLVSNLIALGSSTLVRFFISDQWIWGRPRPHASAQAPAQTTWLYSIHGILRISSVARLPELEPFRRSLLDGPIDLEVVQGASLGRGTSVGETEASYAEAFRDLGFALRVHMGTPMRAEVSRLVLRSPHVLYTNVVEPIIRWLFVGKGYALVHGACLELDGEGLLITAKTDTGKTTTCLRSLCEQNSLFLSDDMVIVSADGEALAYPKPLTISAHTMRAVSNAPLSLSRRAWLHLQSRIHSRTGRRFGFLLNRMRMPAATLNAVLQILVPPPKLFVEEVIPGALKTEKTTIRHIVLIERGGFTIQPLSVEDSTQRLCDNTEDAFGFPPYPALSRFLVNGSARLERDIIGSVATRANGVKIRIPDRDWVEHLRSIVVRESSAAS